MLLELLKLPWSAFRHGEIHGYPVTRNPIAWIPFFLALPAVFVAWLLFIVGYILFLPLILTWGYLALRSFQRKAGVFSQEGIHFPNAYGRLTIAWSEIREVVREREAKAIFYRIICGIAAEPVREYIISSTPDDEGFERTLRERQIPFRVHDWLDTTKPVG